MSRPPKASTAPPTMASTPAGVPASAAMAMALPPAPAISAITASAFAPSRSATATCAPRAANPMAVARPIPEPAPDTSATLPSKRMSALPAALGTRHTEVSRNDHLLLHHEGLDASDEERAVGEEGFGLRRGVGAGHGRAVVVPKLGDAVDLDRRRGDVGARRLLADVRLHVAPEPRHGVSERGVDRAEEGRLVFRDGVEAGAGLHEQVDGLHVVVKPRRPETVLRRRAALQEELRQEQVAASGERVPERGGLEGAAALFLV